MPLTRAMARAGSASTINDDIPMGTSAQSVVSSSKSTRSRIIRSQDSQDATASTTTTRRIAVPVVPVVKEKKSKTSKRSKVVKKISCITLDDTEDEDDVFEKSIEVPTKSQPTKNTTENNTFIPPTEIKRPKPAKLKKVMTVTEKIPVQQPPASTSKVTQKDVQPTTEQAEGRTLRRRGQDNKAITQSKATEFDNLVPDVFASQCRGTAFAICSAGKGLMEWTEQLGKLTEEFKAKSAANIKKIIERHNAEKEEAANKVSKKATNVTTTLKNNGEKAENCNPTADVTFCVPATNKISKQAADASTLKNNGEKAEDCNPSSDMTFCVPAANKVSKQVEDATPLKNNGEKSADSNPTLDVTFCVPAATKLSKQVTSVNELKSIGGEKTTGSNPDETFCVPSPVPQLSKLETDVTVPLKNNGEKAADSNATFNVIKTTQAPVKRSRSIDLFEDSSEELVESKRKNKITFNFQTLADQEDIPVQPTKKVIVQSIDVYEPNQNGARHSSSSTDSFKTCTSSSSSSSSKGSARIQEKDGSKTGTKNDASGSSKSDLNKPKPGFLKKAEREEEAEKRKNELLEQRKELAKQKNDEWKKKADKIRQEEAEKAAAAALKTTNALKSNKIPEKVQPIKPVKPFVLPHFLTKPFETASGLKNSGPMKFKHPMPGPISSPLLTSAGTFKPTVRIVEDVFKNPNCSILDVTADSTMNSYDITVYEDLDEDLKHRENKRIPEWASKSKGVSQQLFKQVNKMDFDGFPSIKLGYKLFP